MIEEKCQKCGGELVQEPAPPPHAGKLVCPTHGKPVVRVRKKRDEEL